jgi:hypothetical protein
MENEVVAPDTVETPAPETQAVEAPQTAPAEPQSRADTIREALTKDTDKPWQTRRYPTPRRWQVCA